MSSIGTPFQRLSNSLTETNKKLSPRGPQFRLGGSEIGPPGPLGFSEPRAKLRQHLDQRLQVAPLPGDPGYVAPPEPTAPAPVTPMTGNDPSDLNIIAARRRSIEEQMRRRGRVSTVLSQPQNEPLGG